MNILVTGGTGLLGAVISKRLGEHHAVAAVSRNPKGSSTAACDLTKPAEVEKLFSKQAFDAVIHTAAYSDVDGCELDPALAHASNALSTKYLAAHCGQKKVPFVYVSTDYVFDGRKRTPYTEGDRVCPVNIYGLTKLAGESYARALAPLSAIVRTSWLFGPGNPKNFVNHITAKLRKDGAADVLVEQEDSPTSVGDLSEALTHIVQYLVDAKKQSKPVHEIFHVCNAGGTTRYAMTVKIAEILGLKDARIGKIDKSAIPDRPALRPHPYVVMSCAHYEKTFGVRLRPWQESLEEYLKSPVSCASS